MNITDVRIRKLEDSGKRKATASITIDDCFVVHDLSIIENEKGTFVAMPAKKNQKTGEFMDTAHPLNNETRKQITKAVLDAYNK